MPEATISVKIYEPWMRDQIIRLAEVEYPFMKGWFEKRFEALYESQFMSNRNHLIVAVDGTEKVIACISYIHWPISYKGKSMSAYQMAGLIVAPAARGKGLFKSVLARMDELLQTLKPDIVLGFPVPESKEGFLKQGWKNKFDLSWYMMPVNWMSIFRKTPFSGKGFEKNVPVMAVADPFIQTAPDQEFWNLREAFFPDWPSYHKTYFQQGHPVQIIFRIQKVKGLQVAVIGRIYSGEASCEQVYGALKLWITDLRKNGTVAAATAAVNEHCSSGEPQAIRKLMFRTSKKILVIVKSYSENTNVYDSANWNLMRADMETW